MSKKETYINGPVNVIRMNGEIDGIKKVIYLFLDYHYTLNEQKECDHLDSIDVHQYFGKLFKKINSGKTVYDFFLEIYPRELADKRNYVSKKNKDIYIEQVVKLFQKIFKFDASKNKVSINKRFKNVRLHYLDIRDYFLIPKWNKINDLFGLSEEIRYNNEINSHEISKIMKRFTEAKELVIELREYFEGNLADHIKVKIISNLDDKASPDISIPYLVNKAKNKYHHQHVKKAINQYINSIIDYMFEITAYIDRSIITLRKYLNIIDSYTPGDLFINKENYETFETNLYHFPEMLMTEIVTNIYIISKKLINKYVVTLFAKIMDIFLLRRFLDKSYIQNAIVYTGAYHSINYIHFLSKYFDFKITHMANEQPDNLSKLNQKIKTMKIDEIGEFLLPKYFTQCSNLTNFPEYLT